MAHVHWRVLLSGSTGANYTEFYEMAFLGAGDTDLSTGGTATASTIWSGAYPASNAFDKSLSTSWSSAAGFPGGWLAYQHPSAVDAVAVSFSFNGSAVAMPGGAAAQHSDDGVHWSTPYALVPRDLWFGSAAVSSTRIFDLVAAPVPLSGVFTTGSLTSNPSSYGGIALGTYAGQRNHLTGGDGYLHGTVAKRVGATNVPAQRRVFLMRETDGLVTDATTSNPETGEFFFYNADMRCRFSAIGHDVTPDKKRAVIRDDMEPLPMPFNRF